MTRTQRHDLQEGAEKFVLCVYRNFATLLETNRRWRIELSPTA